VSSSGRSQGGEEEQSGRRAFGLTHDRRTRVDSPVMNETIASLRGEYKRYKALGEGALRQLEDRELFLTTHPGGNSVVSIVWHIAGNLASRFRDFLTTDGEKPGRDRESEFSARTVTRAQLMEKWESGWATLFATLDSLDDESLGLTVTIRNEPLSVRQALHRSLAHTSYHVGQIVFHARSLKGAAWKFLSIPPARAGQAAEPAATDTAGLLAGRLERTFAGSMWYGPSLKEALDGVTPAEAVSRPIAGAHTILEMVRHMTIQARAGLEYTTGQWTGGPTPEEDWPAVEDTLDEQAWQGHVATLESSYRQLAATTRGMGSGPLAVTPAGGRRTVEDVIRGVVEHGIYHGGQIALVVRALRGPSRP
jgi:uncharacterized damage-inducible protein DinB